MVEMTLDTGKSVVFLLVIGLVEQWFTRITILYNDCDQNNCEADKITELKDLLSDKDKLDVLSLNMITQSNVKGHTGINIPKGTILIVNEAD